MEQQRLLEDAAATADPSLISGTRFDDQQLGLHPSLQRAVMEKMNLEVLTDIQARTFGPIAWQESSIVARERTGTGKTLAFLLPAIQRLLKEDPVAFMPGRQVGLLIIAPTRELVQQIADTAQELLTFLPSQQWTAQAIYGGTKITREMNLWNRALPTILVSTPGRLVDHIQQDTRVRGGKRFTKAVLEQTRIVVLDEADRLVEGFTRECRMIVQKLPRKRQTLLFSATLPRRLRSLLEEVISDKDFVTVDCVNGSDVTTETNASIEQSYLVLKSMEDYVATLVAILRLAMEQDKDYKVVLFFPTAKLVRFFADFLSLTLEDIKPLEIHSRMSQASRNKASETFRQARQGVLITSDVSARGEHPFGVCGVRRVFFYLLTHIRFSFTGVDYPDVTLVVQYGAPYTNELYLHRLGRTGRMGKEGRGIQVLLPFEKPYRARLVKKGVQEMENDGSVYLQEKDSNSLARGKQWVRNAHASLAPKAEVAYLSFVAYYAEYAHSRVSGEKILKAGEAFAKTIGLNHLPALPDRVVGQLNTRR